MRFHSHVHPAGWFFRLVDEDSHRDRAFFDIRSVATHACAFFLRPRSGVRMLADTAQLDRQTIAQYDLLEKIAEGGMGSVYKGRDRFTGQIVAIKVVPPHLLNNQV